MAEFVHLSLHTFRRIDRLYLRDMIDVALIDATWPPRLPPPFGERLQSLLDDPNG